MDAATWLRQMGGESAQAEKRTQLAELCGYLAGLDTLDNLLFEGMERVAAFFARGLREVHLLVPYTDGNVINRLRGVASDLRTEHTLQGIEVQARLPEAEARRYAAYVMEDETAGHA